MEKRSPGVSDEMVDKVQSQIEEMDLRRLQDTVAQLWEENYGLKGALIALILACGEDEIEIPTQVLESIPPLGGVVTEETDYGIIFRFVEVDDEDELLQIMREAGDLG